MYNILKGSSLFIYSLRRNINGLYKSINRENIVEEISKITNANTNLMNEKGIIIASTNRSRIGTLHKGAKKIIEENLKELHVSPELEDDFTKTGINLPIQVNYIPIGVIGITGPYEEVIKHASLVKRITEILVGESIRREKKLNYNQLLQDFLNTWILGDGLSQGDKFLNLGMALNIDMKIPRRIILFQVRVQNEEDYRFWYKDVESIREFFLNQHEFKHTFHVISDINIALIVHLQSSEKLKILAKNTQSKLLEHFKLKTFFGIDNIEEGTTALNVSYIQAKQAAQAAELVNKKGMFYDDICIERLIPLISEVDKKIYLKKLFPDKNQELMPHFMNVIETWFLYNGSITKSAEALFMHKNTFQYQLKRIQESSGYDIRKPYGTAIFYITLMFYRYLSLSDIQY